ncbi:MAG: DUF4293 family protein [Flavobacteriaceae bacterium]|jgi:hypothetical protein|nr:DUF4293 family protein [Flavobacteriaceae bacterium]MBT4297625.1 DUF4293 family protein [Flavobacteriaceae bacterium]MDB2648200.1 DUF4293 domain-containing protein [Flavobacteriaceae bacterium]MDB4601535.1 DUF4293 domain-containing protein [Flavobacteriaceae bacterium]MDC0506351.1 DUF4293 domain-containing protein [Flavobacteriaceae bacterium]
MLQRVQSLYMFLMFLLNIIIVISLDSDPTASLPDSYFGYFRPYVENYFFAEISAMIILINIFLFKKPSYQINILRFLSLTLVFGLINLFDERSLKISIIDPGLIYFLISFFLIFMSISSIKKDQAIISSSNRLR